MFIKVSGIFLPLLVLITASFSSAVIANSPDSINGNWSCNENGSHYMLEFSSDNKLIFQGQSLSYQIQASTLLIEEEYGIIPHIFELKDANLTILSPDGSVSYCKKGAL